ncbi:hypothetical protein [Rhizobium sp. GR12]|uniref:hypothetical protein n=1 Tax=Rhizobium sp. GR12 TaxID=3053925 RepID=UPI002FBD70C1
MTKEWAALLHDEFDPEFSALPEEVQDEIFAALPLLKAYGHNLVVPTPIRSRDRHTRT